MEQAIISDLKTINVSSSVLKKLILELNPTSILFQIVRQNKII